MDPIEVKGLGAAFLLNLLKEGPDITFSELDAMNGQFFQCKYGIILLGNGRTRREALLDAKDFLAVLQKKLEKCSPCEE